MAHEDKMMSHVLDAQKRIGRLAERDYGLSLKKISLESGIPYPTIRSYFSQARDVRLAEMPVSALCKLVDVIPDELLSHMLQPVGRLIDRCPEDDDHDVTAENCIQFLTRKQKAHHPESPAGVDIAPCESDELKLAKARLA
jgi:hypothetical protein